MFKKIFIRNFITFKKIEIDFDKGFTVFTGETGAGKSLLIDALMLVLGYRADTRFIRKNEDFTEIIAEFELEKKSVETNSLYQQFVFEDDGHFIFRRLIDKNGKSKTWINDTPVTLTKIRELAKNFISIYGQHSQIGLMTSEGQRFLLDEYADSAFEAKLVKDLYKQLNELKIQLEKIKSDNLIFSKELEILEWQLLELKQLNFVGNEWEKQEELFNKYNNLENYMLHTNKALDELSNSNDSILNKLKDVIEDVIKISEYNSEAKSLVEILKESEINLEDVLYSLRKINDDEDLQDFDFESLKKYVDRVYGFCAKYRIKPGEIDELEKKIQAQILSIKEKTDVSLLKEKMKKIENDYVNNSSILSAKRVQAIEKIIPSVNVLLKNIGMENADFKIHLPKTNNFTSYGNEGVEFLISSNKGSDYSLINKIASGGELSRICLAMLVELTKKTDSFAIVFDEVDNGISGEIAKKVGGLINTLSINKQILCVTHLSQVAVQADNQFHITKKMQDEKTFSNIEKLNRNERIVEIAKMTDGDNPSKFALDHAEKSLIENIKD